MTDDRLHNACKIVFLIKFTIIVFRIFKSAENPKATETTQFSLISKDNLRSLRQQPSHVQSLDDV